MIETTESRTILRCRGCGKSISWQPEGDEMGVGEGIAESFRIVHEQCPDVPEKPGYRFVVTRRERSVP